MRIDITGKVGQFKAEIERELPSRAERAANELRNAVIDVFRGSRGGRTYRTPRGGTYTASSPGEPPAWRTGTLATHWEPKRYGPNGINPAIETSVSYAWLDEGSPGGMIKPRPYVKKTVEKALPAIEAIYSEPYHFR